MTRSEVPVRPLRVLHAPVNVGNQPWTLSRAERRLGVESDLVTNYSTWIGYPADRVLSSVGDMSLRGLANRISGGIAAPFKYDVIHYYFGRSLLFWDDLSRFNRLPYADLHIAKWLGRKIFMTLQGCDSRIASLSNRRYAHTTCAEGRCSAYSACIDHYDQQRMSMIANVLPQCDRVFFLNPELGHYAPNATFLPYANVDIGAIDILPPRQSGVPRIVHSPSDPAIKGTRQILEALDALKSRYEFELILVQNKSHAEAMRIYRDADIAIDQIFIGWYGGFSVEMMAMGKPVACYIRDEDLAVVPPKMREQLPILRINPDTLASDIASILERRAEWTAIGKRSRAFVERWHDPDRIAARMIELYKSPATELFS